MLMPFMVLFVIFTVIPVVMSVPVSFTDFNMIQSPEFIGISNYTALFLSDKIFMKSIRITLIFAFFTGIISYIMCFMMAWLIDSMPHRIGNFFTVIFYIPSMANVYSVWRVIFSGDMNGYINSLLISIGIITSPIQWLTDGRYILFTAIIVQMWLSLGAGFLAIRAGLRGIDRSMYEAGAVKVIKNTSAITPKNIHNNSVHETTSDVCRCHADSEFIYSRNSHTEYSRISEYGL